MLNVTKVMHPWERRSSPGGLLTRGRREKNAQKHRFSTGKALRYSGGWQGAEHGVGYPFSTIPKDFIPP